MILSAMTIIEVSSNLSPWSSEELTKSLYLQWNKKLKRRTDSSKKLSLQIKHLLKNLLFSHKHQPQMIANLTDHHCTNSLLMKTI